MRLVRLPVNNNSKNDYYVNPDHVTYLYKNKMSDCTMVVTDDMSEEEFGIPVTLPIDTVAMLLSGREQNDLEETQNVSK